MLHSTCHHWHSPTTATPTSSSPLCGDAAVLDSSGDSSSDNAVQELAELLRNAGTEYLRRIEDSSLSQTLSQDEEHVQDLIRDVSVKVDIPPNALITHLIILLVHIAALRQHQRILFLPAQASPLPLMLPLCQRDNIRPPRRLQSFLLKLKMAIVVSLQLSVTVVRFW